MSQKKDKVQPTSNLSIGYTRVPRSRPTYVRKTTWGGTKVQDFTDRRAIEKVIAASANKPYAFIVESGKAVVWKAKDGQLIGLGLMYKTHESSQEEVNQLIDFINEE